MIRALILITLALVIVPSAGAQTRHERAQGREMDRLLRMIVDLRRDLRYDEAQLDYDSRVLGCMGWLPLTFEAYRPLDGSGQVLALTVGPDLTRGDYWMPIAGDRCLNQVDDGQTLVRRRFHP